MRQAMRARRRALAVDEKVAAAAAVASRLLALAPFRAAPALIAYVATDGEVPTEALLAAAADAGKPLHLPRLVDGVMRFAGHRLGAPLREGRFGIAEPQSEPVDPADLVEAIAIVPLVAWDLQGGRVGRGGGHYDRAFAFPYRPRWLVGVGYAFQQVTRVPQDPWDLRLDSVVTERATVTCRIGGAAPLLRKEDRDDHEQHDLDTGQPGAGGRSGLRAGRSTAPAVRRADSIDTGGGGAGSGGSAQRGGGASQRG